MIIHKTLDTLNAPIRSIRGAYASKSKVRTDCGPNFLPADALVAVADVVRFSVRHVSVQAHEDGEARQNVLARVRVCGLEARPVPGESHLGSRAVDKTVDRQENGSGLCDAHKIVLGHEANDGIGTDVGPFPCLCFLVAADWLSSGARLASLRHQIDLAIVEDVIGIGQGNSGQSLNERGLEGELVGKLDAVEFPSGLERDELDVRATGFDGVESCTEHLDIEDFDFVGC